VLPRYTTENATYSELSSKSSIVAIYLCELLYVTITTQGRQGEKGMDINISKEPGELKL
jgi:hypothetical protein